MSTKLTRGHVMLISPSHPFYPNELGVFECQVGETLVFSRPREDEEEPKVFFMVRPEDTQNYINMLADLAAERERALEPAVNP